MNNFFQWLGKYPFFAILSFAAFVAVAYFGGRSSMMPVPGTVGTNASGHSNPSNTNFIFPGDQLINARELERTLTSTPTREQIEELRRAYPGTTVQAIISAIAQTACINPGQQFTIQGRGFGAIQGARTVWLSLRGIDFSAVEVVTWADTEIVARIPSDIGRAANFTVGIKDGSHRYVSNLTRRVGVCFLTLVTEVEAEIAPIIPEYCFAIDSAVINYACDGDTCRIVDGERVVFDYESRFQSNNARRALFHILDNEYEEQCIGPVQQPWVRPDGSIGREYAPFTYWKKGGDIADSGTGLFSYGLVCEQPRERIQWDILEVRLLASGDWGIGWPEIHADREFGFNVLSEWATQSDANWVKLLHIEKGLHTRCSQNVDAAGSGTIDFKFWAQ